MTAEGQVAEEVRYVHASDGTRLSATILRPEGRCRGVFLLVHGFSQNRKAFLQGHLPWTLARAGFTAIVGELRGHGRSDRPSKWSVEDHLLRDLPSLKKLAEVMGEGRPVHYLGHSMGGVLGFASLAEGLGWASVTGLAAPLELGRGSPLVGAAARLVTPLVWLAGDRRVSMDRFLAALSGFLAWPSAPLPVRAVQRLLALANPNAADPIAIREVLRSSDPESMEVFRAFLRSARGLETRASARTGGASAAKPLEVRVRGATIPLAAVVGGLDIFAPPPSVRLLLTGKHAGPRRVVSLPRASHVDLTVGEDVARTVEGLIPFLEPS